MSMAGPHGVDPDDWTTSGSDGYGPGARLGPGDLAPDVDPPRRVTPNHLRGHLTPRQRDPQAHRSFAASEAWAQPERKGMP